MQKNNPVAAVGELPIPASSKPSCQTPLKEQKLHTIRVVIDPGHGGKDPGAIGVYGLQEKNIVLHLAQMLQQRLNKTSGFHAVLTRNGDYYLGLRERLNVARLNHPDLFIAIHADAYWNPASQGVSLFALSPRGATSEAARWLAERENESELMGGVTLADKSNLLRSVLIDLSQTATIDASIQLGQILLQKLAPISSLHYRRVEQAAFMVLRSPDIPSLLLETGFLSNHQEALRLHKRHYQEQLMNGVATGIEEYFLRHPPEGQ